MILGFQRRPTPTCCLIGQFTVVLSQCSHRGIRFAWTDASFERPDQENLLIYELLVRDFTEDRTLKAIEDTLDYLENLGVQAIELMPVSNQW